MANMNKKGVETIIAWVLLVGFTVALGAVVSNWAIQQAKQINPEKMANPDLYCDNLRLSVEPFVCNPNLNSITVQNKGYRNSPVTFVKVLTDKGTQNINTTQLLGVNQEIEIPINCEGALSGANIERIDVVPSVNTSKELIRCEEKVYILKEDILSTCQCP